MELPLFKGIATDQLSQILEKTKVEFLSFQHNDIILEQATMVDSISFIIKGEIRNIYKFSNLDIRIIEFLKEGSVVGAKHLLGLDTTYRHSSYAVGQTSVMRIGKEDYLSILHDNNICLLNYLNYLSAAIQRPELSTLDSKKYDFSESLRKLLSPIINPSSSRIEILGDINKISLLLGVDLNERDMKIVFSKALWSIETNSKGIILESQK